VLARLAVRGVVDVGEVALTQALEPGVELDLVREVVVQGKGAHHAQVDALLLGRLGDPFAFLEEDLFLRILVQRDVLGQDELSHQRLPPPSGALVIDTDDGGDSITPR